MGSKEDVLAGSPQPDSNNADKRTSGISAFFIFAGFGSNYSTNTGEMQFQLTLFLVGMKFSNWPNITPIIPPFAIKTQSKPTKIEASKDIITPRVRLPHTTCLFQFNTNKIADATESIVQVNVIVINYQLFTEQKRCQVHFFSLFIEDTF